MNPTRNSKSTAYHPNSLSPYQEPRDSLRLRFQITTAIVVVGCLLTSLIIIMWTGTTGLSMRPNISSLKLNPSVPGVTSMMAGSTTAAGDDAISTIRSSRQLRLQRALWAFFAGDALASPSHWFYGGFRQVKEYYGPQGIVDYTQPVFNLAGSILNKSNLNGGGRSTTANGSSISAPDRPASIVGHVILHGKQDLWSPMKQIHYHATLKAGENTLEAQLGRVLMRSISSTQGKFDADHFRQAYIDFMTRPGSHNDTYASTCHRMFFANLIYKNLPPEQCPDNDSHNVDTIDGLVLPTIVALSVSARSDGTAIEAAQQAALCASVTRKSPVLQRAAAAWAKLVFYAVRQDDLEQTPSSTNLVKAAGSVASEMGYRQPTPRDEMTACYLDSAMPALLDGVVKYGVKGSSVWQALLANANAGGENVHRGSCLGAVLGANSDQPLETRLIDGLYDRTHIDAEITTFVESLMDNQ